MSQASTDRAANEAKRRKVELRIITGDAMQGIAHAMSEAKLLADKAGGIPILCTIMALLHELPSRSPGFDLLHFFASLRDAAVVVGREPVEPSNWEPDVILSGNFDADLFARFANDVLLGRYAQCDPESRDMKLKVVAKNKVSGHRGLILEALVKAFYNADLLYELNEWFTWFSEQSILRALHLCFEQSHSVNSYGPSPSYSIRNLWRLYGLQAEAKKTPSLTHGMPGSHLWYEAIRKDLIRP